MPKTKCEKNGDKFQLKMASQTETAFGSLINSEKTPFFVPFLNHSQIYLPNAFICVKRILFN